jgi:hypothetical protein
MKNRRDERVPMNKGFKRSALQYLTMWWEGDRGFIESLQKKPIEASLKKMCIAYGVNRNLGGKYKQFAKRLNDCRNPKVTRENVQNIVGKFG